MLRVDSEKVYIEHCINCKSHNWCTNHNEEKYKEWYSRCQTVIMRSCYNVTVVENIIPEGFNDHFITDPNASKPGKLHFPRIGSFEVYFRGSRIFSKIESMKWPQATRIAEKIKEIQDTPLKDPKTKKKLKAKRLKSASATKKKKSKKLKKKTAKKKIKPSFNSFTNKEEHSRKRFDELFKSQSSDSSDKGKDNYIEQPAYYEYYKAPLKEKTPPKRLDSFGQEKKETVQNIENKNPESANVVRQVKKVEKIENEPEKLKAKNDSSNYSSSESYESNPEIEKIDLKGQLGKVEKKRVSESEEYKSEDYEKYQDSSEKNSGSEEYEEDYNDSQSSDREKESDSSFKKKSIIKNSDSSDSGKSSSSDVKKHNNKHSDSSDSKSRKKKISSDQKSSSEGYSEDQDYEEYDQDFNDDDSSEKDNKKHGKKAGYY